MVCWSATTNLKASVMSAERLAVGDASVAWPVDAGIRPSNHAEGAPYKCRSGTVSLSAPLLNSIQRGMPKRQTSRHSGSYFRRGALTVLIAPHHGLESCYSPERFGAMKGGKPRLNILSERRKSHD